jgi:tetratricopeptide (TPR) repeat protein
MQKEKLLFIILFISSLTFSQKSDKELKAELYFRKASEILDRTVHNALSQKLSNEALKYAKKAIELNSKPSRYYSLIGTIYKHLKKNDLGLNNFNIAIKIDSTNFSALTGKAMIFENSNQFSLAEKNYLKALKYDKDPTTIIYNMGLLYSKWGKIDLSLKCYDEVIKKSPEFTSPYINRGELKLQLKLYEDAISDFNVAISLDTINKVSYNNRGLGKFYLKNYNSAISDFEKSISINLGKSFNENYNTDIYAYNNMANAYLAIGNIKKACEFWNVAIRNGYKYQAEWKELYNIENPIELIKIHCK